MLNEFQLMLARPNLDLHKTQWVPQTATSPLHKLQQNRYRNWVSMNFNNNWRTIFTSVESNKKKMGLHSHFSSTQFLLRFPKYWFWTDRFPPPLPLPFSLFLLLFTHAHPLTHLRILSPHFTHLQDITLLITSSFLNYLFLRHNSLGCLADSSAPPRLPDL